MPGVSLLIYSGLPSVVTRLYRRGRVRPSWVNLIVTRLSWLSLLLGVSILSLLPRLDWFIVGGFPLPCPYYSVINQHPGLIVFSVSFNIRALILVILTTYVDKSADMSRVYTLMSMTEALAHIGGSPLIESI